MVSGIGGYGFSGGGVGLNIPYLPSSGCSTNSFAKYQEKLKEQNKVSFGEGLKAFGKGLIKPITNIFKHPIKSALMIGAGIAVCALGGAPLLIGAGLAFGGFQIAKGGYKAMTAKTKTEKLNAWEDVGEGTFTVGASLAGARAYAKTTPYGSAVTKNLGALNKNAGIGTRASAVAKGLYSDAVTTMKDVPGSATKVVSGLYRKATTAVPKSGTMMTSTKTSTSTPSKPSSSFRPGIDYDMTENPLTGEWEWIPSEGSTALTRYSGTTSLTPYGSITPAPYSYSASTVISPYVNVFRNAPAANIAMGLGGQLDLDPQTVETMQKVAPAYGINLFPQLNFPTPNKNPFLSYAA